MTIPDLVGNLTIQLSSESDSGTKGDSVTKDSLVTMEGTGPTNETLNFYGENDVFLANTTVDVLGNWIVENVSLTSGHQIFYIVRGEALPSVASMEDVASRSGL